MSTTPPDQAPTRQTREPRSGRWFMAFIGLSLAIIGGLFVFLMARSFMRAKEMRNWPKVPCVILASELEERRHDPNSPIEYRHRVSFGYEWQGQGLLGEKTTLRGNPWTNKRNLADERLAEFSVGMNTECFVHPQNPELAVLKPDSLAPGYSIWFPALFMIAGLGITINALAGPRRAKLARD